MTCVCVSVLLELCVACGVQIFEGKYAESKAAWDIAMADFQKKHPQPPAVPKRPLTGFMLFCGENRATINAENPGLKTTELAKVMPSSYMHHIQSLFPV